MIVCANCNTCQFLQITSSTIYFKDGEDVHEVTEQYECTLCGSTGEYEWGGDSEEPSVRGEVTLQDNEPQWPTAP